jgi:hypothetical protein
MIKYEIISTSGIESGEMDEQVAAYAAVKLLGSRPALREGLGGQAEEAMTVGLQSSANIEYRRIDSNFSDQWTLRVWSDKRRKVSRRTIC